MRFNFFYIVIIITLCFISCKKNIEIKEVNTNILKETVILYLDSSKQIIENTNLLISEIKEPSKNYNKIVVDSFNIGNRKFYALLMEHPIPVFNLFAIFDDSLNILLRDNSLNGYLDFTKLGSFEFDIIKLTENYKSLDVFNITRLSFYKKIGSKFYLVFRGIISFTSPNDTLIRNLISINDTMIICSIPRTKYLVKNEIKYIYKYDNLLRLFSTEKDYMDSLVIREINNFSSEFSSNQILNKKSFLDLIKQKSVDTLNLEISDYEFTIPADWTSLENITFQKILKKKAKGKYFVNKSLGVNIGIIKIQDFENSEDYINTTFSYQKQLRDYTIRETVIQEDIKYFSQAIEHDCGGKKYLLIIEGSKNSYLKNQEYFKNILSSFAINCD